MEPLKKNSSVEEQQTLDFDKTEQDLLEKKLTMPRHTEDSIKLAYYTLLASALDHRKLFIDEEIKSIKNSPEPDAQQALSSIPPDQRKGLRKLSTKNARKIHNDSIKGMINKIQHLHKSMKAEIDGVKMKMDDKTAKAFDSTVQMLNEATEQFLFARSIQEVVGLLRMYNAGELDILFENARKVQHDKEVKEEQDAKVTE